MDQERGDNNEAARKVREYSRQNKAAVQQDVRRTLRFEEGQVVFWYCVHAEGGLRGVDWMGPSSLTGSWTGPAQIQTIYPGLREATISLDEGEYRVKFAHLRISPQGLWDPP